MESKPFHYPPRCASPRCETAAVYKVAAPWSNGSNRELKNYALACEAHRDSQLALAQIRRKGLSLADGENLGTVGLYQLKAGDRDAALVRLPDHG